MGTNGSGGKTSGPAPARAKPVGSSTWGRAARRRRLGRTGKGGAGRRRGVASSAVANRTARAPRSGRSRQPPPVGRHRPPRGNLPYTVGPRRDVEIAQASVRSTLARQPAIHVATSAARLVWSLAIVLGSRRAASRGRLTAVDVRRIITQAWSRRSASRSVTWRSSIARVTSWGVSHGRAAPETELRGGGRGGPEGTFFPSRFPRSPAGTAAFFSTVATPSRPHSRLHHFSFSHFPPRSDERRERPAVRRAVLPASRGDVNPKLPLGLSGRPGCPALQGMQAVGGRRRGGHGDLHRRFRAERRGRDREERIAVLPRAALPTPERSAATAST